MAERNVISKVEYTSPLYGKVKVGDVLLSINDHPIKDVLDYKYYGYDHRLSLQILTAEGKTKKLRVRKAEGEDLGLEFATYLMDAPRSCANRCVFCFIDQNPPGMRKSIYFKDDDARLPISAEASRGYSHLTTGTSKGSFTPLLHLKKFPALHVSTREEAPGRDL